MVGAGFEDYVYNLSIFTCSYHNIDAYVVRRTPYVVRAYSIHNVAVNLSYRCFVSSVYIHRLHSISFTTNVS